MSTETAPQRKRSCADRLHKLQKSFGLSDKELKQAVHDACAPREVELPTFHEEVSEAEKIREKEEKLGAKSRRYMLAHWYLEEWCEPYEAKQIYLKYTNFKELVNYAYECAIGTIQICTGVVSTTINFEELFPHKQKQADWEIPEIREREFDEYCKTHPLNDASDIIKRRRKFRKHCGRRRKKLYSRKRMRMYDPLFSATAINEKEVLKNIKRVSAENQLRIQRFNEMLDSLVGNRAIGSVALAAFNQQTQKLMSQYEKRIDELMTRMHTKPTKVIFDPVTSYHQ